MRRRLLGVDKRLSNHYFATIKDPKLHIGGGWHTIDGWLNTDIALLPGVMSMDATAAFPFPDETFAFVFSEHMIEHVPYGDGARMLRECHRVLREGGTIRVTTPDLAALAALYSDTHSVPQQQYLSWFCATFLSATQPHTAVSVINAHFRLWGHQFLYDQDTLCDALKHAGFSRVVRRRLGESDHSELRLLENAQRYPEGLLDFESVALEATK